VPELLFLPEKKTATAHPVLHRQRVHGKKFLFVYLPVNRLVKFQEIDFKGKVGVGVPEAQAEQLRKPGRAEKVEGGGAALQLHGGDKAKQPEIMVPVHVADKNIADALGLYLKAHQLHLRAFSAIN
jgi:hypothetical protein